MPDRNKLKARSKLLDERANATAGVVERDAIRNVIAEWALARDTAQWEKLRSLYAPDATMQTTWFEGSADEFVERSAKGFGRSARAQHLVGASVIELGDTRATAETRIVLLLRAALGRAQVDVTCYGRFFDFLETHGSKWRICNRVPIYEKDRIDPVNPLERLDIDYERLWRFAEGYRHVAYVQSLAGADVTKGLIEPGSVEEQNLYREGAKWLAQEKGENHDGDTRPR
jgi:SnoaL-like domain